MAAVTANLVRGTFSIHCEGDKKSATFDVTASTKATELMTGLTKESMSAGQVTAITFKGTLMPEAFESICQMFSKAKTMTLEAISRDDLTRLVWILSKDDVVFETDEFYEHLFAETRHGLDYGKVSLQKGHEKDAEKFVGALTRSGIALEGFNLRNCMWVTTAFVNMVWTTFTTTLTRMDFTGSKIFAEDANVNNAAKALAERDFQTQLLQYGINLKVYFDKTSVLAYVTMPSEKLFVMPQQQLAVLGKAITGGSPTEFVEMLGTDAAKAAQTKPADKDKPK